MIGQIEYFRLEITPWHYGPRSWQADEWRIRAVVNGKALDLTRIMEKIPFNQSEIEFYLRWALDMYSKAGELELDSEAQP